jgi:hypothetical protein
MTATPDVELMPGIKDALRGRQFNLYEVSNLKMNDHVMQLLRNSQEIIHICGFSLSIDILPMVLDLMRDGRKIAIIKDCIGDITFDHKERSLAVLEFLGIPII